MDLLSRAQQFELEALEWIYDQYNQGLYYYALHLLGDPNLAEDCLAETFSRFLHALHKRKGPQNHIKAYLYRSAHNWATDYYRGRKEDAMLDDDLPANESDGVGMIVERNLEQARTREALFQLPADQSQVVALHFIEGWEIDEIAAALDKSIGAVKALQHRALVNLRKMMKE